jgi:hypothetical protein
VKQRSDFLRKSPWEKGVFLCVFAPSRLCVKKAAAMQQELRLPVLAAKPKPLKRKDATKTTEKAKSKRWGQKYETQL